MSKPYWAGWNNEAGHDKIWGFVVMDSEAKNLWMRSTNSEAYIFWAARGKAMQFKKTIHNYDLLQLMHKKTAKGYVAQSPFLMEEIWPGFESELSQLLSFAVLTGRIKK